MPEELPPSFETSEVKKEDAPAPVPEKAAEWLLQAEKTKKPKASREKKPKLSSTAVEQVPEAAAGVIPENQPENMAEVDFERRHEVRDEPSPLPPPISGMVPLSQVLAEHPTQAAPDLEIPLVSTPQLQPPHSVKPLVRRMVLSGVFCGIALVLAMVFIFDK